MKNPGMVFVYVKIKKIASGWPPEAALARPCT